MLLLLCSEAFSNKEYTIKKAFVFKQRVTMKKIKRIFLTVQTLFESFTKSITFDFISSTQFSKATYQFQQVKNKLLKKTLRK